MVSPKFRGVLSSSWKRQISNLAAAEAQSHTEATSQAKTVLAPMENIVDTCRECERAISQTELLYR
jgi:hypothetical protein